MAVPQPVETERPRAPRLPFANAWFFPAAAIYAAAILPASVLMMLGLLPTFPGLATPAGHAHEMLFGFALAVVAGYLLGPQPQRFTLTLLGCWLVARLGFLCWPASWLAIGGSLLFAVGLLWKVVPRFLGAAKKWRNQTVAPVVVGLGLVSLLASLGLDSSGPWRVPALLLFALLLFFMGGRIIAPAAAGHALSEGRRLDARVQPHIEGAVLLLLGFALGLSLLPWAPAERMVGGLLVGAGALCTIRLLRWQPWRCRKRPDLLVLLLGYAWLALGLLLLGIAQAIRQVRARCQCEALDPPVRAVYQPGGRRAPAGSCAQRRAAVVAGFRGGLLVAGVRRAGGIAAADPQAAAPVDRSTARGVSGELSRRDLASSGYGRPCEHS